MAGSGDALGAAGRGDPPIGSNSPSGHCHPSPPRLHRPSARIQHQQDRLSAGEIISLFAIIGIRHRHPQPSNDNDGDDKDDRDYDDDDNGDDTNDKENEIKARREGYVTRTRTEVQFGAV